MTNEERGLQTIGDTDLSTVDPTELGDLVPVAERPQDADPRDMSGTEDIDANEVKLPRLTIAQGLSPQMTPGDGKYIPGLGMFQMFNDVTGEIYGNGPLTVVPVLRHVTRIEFDPNDKKVPLDREVPAGDPRLKWTRYPDGHSDPPRATEFVEFVCMLLQKGKAPEPIVVSIKTTNKHQRFAADRWTTFIKLRGTAIYRGMYQISTAPAKGKTKDGQETTFGVFIVKNAGFVPTTTVVDGKPAPNRAGLALLEMAKQFHESLQGKVITVARESEGDDTEFNPAELEREPAGSPGM